MVEVKPNEGDLRVWWVPNPPREPFYYPVKTVDEAKKVIDVLAQYDLYLGELIVANGSGLEVYDGEDWTEWDNEDGDDIGEVIDND